MNHFVLMDGQTILGKDENGVFIVKKQPVILNLAHSTHIYSHPGNPKYCDVAFVNGNIITVHRDLGDMALGISKINNGKFIEDWSEK